MGATVDLGILSRGFLSLFKQENSFHFNLEFHLCLSSKVASALVSHIEGWWFDSSWRCYSGPTIETDARHLPEVVEEWQLGVMLTAFPLAFEQVKENITISPRCLCDIALDIMII